MIWKTFYSYFFTDGYLTNDGGGGVGQQGVSKNGQVFSVVVVAKTEGVVGNGWLGEREAKYSTKGMIKGKVEEGWLGKIAICVFAIFWAGWMG